MALEQPFSKRNRYSSEAKEITIREDAPGYLRYLVLQTAIDLGLGPSRLREVLCRVLRVTPSERNHRGSDIRDEAQYLINGCDWFKVYDIIEVLHASLASSDEYSGEDHARVYANGINEFFIDEGIGWQLDGFKGFGSARDDLTVDAVLMSSAKCFRNDFGSSGLPV